MLIFMAGDLLIWGLALYAAFLIRFEGAIPPNDMRRLPVLIAVFLPLKLIFHLLLGQYRVTWHLVGLTDLVNVWKANSLASLWVVAIILFLRSQRIFAGTPRSVLILDYLFSLGAIGIFRMSRRLWDQRERLRRPNGQSVRRILLVGAGAAGERLLRAMFEDRREAYGPVGFIDDDPGKQGMTIHGLPVFGGRAAIPEIVRTQRIDEVIMAIPSASSIQIRGIVERIRQSGVRQIRILPGVHELLSSRAGLQDIREVNVDDLLGRPPVQINLAAIAEFHAGKRVLVTGAAGSIGSEIVRQLTRFSCEEIIAVDANETGLFDLEEGMRLLGIQVPLRTMVADIRDRDKMNWLLRTCRPAVLFHAAAYKHVPLMERHVEEAVKTNILGTFNVAEAAVRAGVETFILVSTDKAVNPQNVLGLTKRMAEHVVQSLSLRGRTRLSAVRFGNVLGSRGSLVPVLQEQIRRGGPVTLTHPDMRRYFMSTAEAVLLVLQTALIDRQTGVFVLDMGEPVRVMDLATELIRLSGLEADKDIPIVFTGVRPGEKLEEELAEAGEEMLSTPFDKIFEIRPNGVQNEMALRLALQELERLAHEMDADGLRAFLTHLVVEQGQPPVRAAAAVSDVARVN